MKTRLLTLIACVLLLSACAAPATAPTGEPTKTVEDTAVPSPTEPPAQESATAPEDTPAPEPTQAPSDTVEPTMMPEDNPVQAQVSFAADVLPIIQQRCIRCHGGDETEEGLDMSSYAALMQGSDHGAVVIPGDAANSPFAVSVETGDMPKRGAKLTAEQVQLFKDWVNQGAIEN